jgi:hypothetical protein
MKGLGLKILFLFGIHPRHPRQRDQNHHQHHQQLQGN